MYFGFINIGDENTTAHNNVKINLLYKNFVKIQKNVELTCKDNQNYSSLAFINCIKPFMSINLKITDRINATNRWINIL